jgi:hypothetical protein
VALPYDYWPASKWRHELSAAGLAIERFDDRIRFYPPILDRVIGRGLHTVISARSGA